MSRRRRLPVRVSRIQTSPSSRAVSVTGPAVDQSAPVKRFDGVPSSNEAAVLAVQFLHSQGVQPVRHPRDFPEMPSFQPRASSSFRHVASGGRLLPYSKALTTSSDSMPASLANAGPAKTDFFTPLLGQHP
jgi:hypothetical protein